MKRVFLPLLLVSIAACGGKSSPTSPTTSATTPTRIIAIEGSLAFGDVPIGQTRDLALTIRNNGNSPLTLGNMTAPASIASTLSASGGTSTIQAGALTTLTVRFTPLATGTFSGTVTIQADHTSGTNTIAMSGTGVGLPITVTGVVRDSTTLRALGGVRVSAIRNDVSAQSLGFAITDGNGFYSMVLPTATAISISYTLTNYNFQSSAVTFTGDTRRDISLVPFWTMSGTGNNVFNLPSYVSRVRIQGTWNRQSTSNFIVQIGNSFPVNEILRESITYDGTHSVIGGALVQIVSSANISWTFTQTQ